jgi:hypothetical protein
MSPSGSVADPVGEAIARATSGLSGGDAAKFEAAMRAGLSQIGEEAPPEALAEEVKQAEAIPPAERLEWARDYAVRQEVGRLSRDSWNLLQQFKARSLPAKELEQRATALLEEARKFDQGRLKKASLNELRYDLGDVEIECRFILSGGKGPVSLRGGKLIK